MPGFSIILPVKNGSNHIRECIQSILAQYYDDFEMLILENCSTDDTLSIIESFDDSRIKIYPAHHSLSMGENWQRAASLPKREFMTLIGHDDLLDRDYLQTMNALIENHPKASLFQTHFRYINANGDEIGKCSPMKEMYSPPDLLQNFLQGKIDLMGTGFLMRSKDYDGIGGIPLYPGLLFADLQLFIQLGSLAYMAVSTKESFSYRKHPASTTSKSSNVQYVDAFECLITYLVSIKNNPVLWPSISSNSTEFLRQYCQSITHRSLRSEKKLQGYSVDKIIEKFREFAEKLENSDFDPIEYRLIKLGRVIDNNQFLRSSFRLFRTIINKPFIR